MLLETVALGAHKDQEPADFGRSPGWLVEAGKRTPPATRLDRALFTPQWLDLWLDEILLSGLPILLSLLDALPQ